MIETIDFSHYFGPDGFLVSPRSSRMARFLGKTVAAASVRELETEELTPLRCIRRLGRVVCSGRLFVCRRRDDTISWRCARCAGAGRIKGWRGTPWDLGSSTEHPSDAERYMFTVTEQEYIELSRMILMSVDCEAIIAGAVLTDIGIHLRAALKEFDDLADHVAAEAAYVNNPRRQRVLDSFSDKIDTFLRIAEEVRLYDRDGGASGAAPAERGAGAKAARPARPKLRLIHGGLSDGD